MSEYTLEPAIPSDAAAIASIFSRTWTSPFTKLQFGKVDPPSLAASMELPIKTKLESSTTQRTMVIRSPEGKVAAVAQWTLPSPTPEVDDAETPERKREMQEFEDETYRNSLPEGSNRDLIMEFAVGLRGLRADILKGRPNYLLENIATDPDHQGKGLATRLLQWVFPLADEAGVIVYLDTASDNPAMRLYKRLGFEEKGISRIERLERFGGVGHHAHVALVRESKR